MYFSKNAKDRGLWLLCCFVLLCVSLYAAYLLLSRSAPEVGWEAVNSQMANELAPRPSAEVGPTESGPLESGPLESGSMKSEPMEAGPTEAESTPGDGARDGGRSGSAMERQTPSASPAEARSSGSDSESGHGGGSELIDINRASSEQLQQLVGIGPTKARAIIEYREQKGGFQNVRQLMEVKGIGPKTFAKIAGQITAGESG